MVKRHVYAPRGGWGVRAVVYLGRDRPHLHGAVTLGQSPFQADWEPSVYWLRGLANQASRVRKQGDAKAGHLVIGGVGCTLVAALALAGPAAED